MKRLKHIRILVSVVMLFECGVLLLAGAGAPLHAQLAARNELSMSMLPVSIGASIGSWVLWLVVTLLLGRVYCSGICVAGTLQDVAGRLSHMRRGHRWKRRPARKVRWWVLGVYVAAVMIGAGIVPLIVEPWPAVSGAVQALLGTMGSARAAATLLGVGALWGGVCAAVAMLSLALFGFLTGRDFCNEVCPVGSVLSLAAARSAFHIEFYPDRCTSCLRCEDVCKAGCIDIKSRNIDNARCVRCFNCLAECPDDALRYELNPHGIVTPMLRRSTNPQV